MKLPCKAKHVVAGDFGNGFCIYALIENKWYSVNANCDTGEVFDIRWEAKEHEIKQIQSIKQNHPSFGRTFCDGDGCDKSCCTHTADP